MMIKPTIVHFAVATVMLRRGWMLRYLPDIVLRNVPETTIVAAGYAWAGLLAALGLANLFVALRLDFATWAWFVSVGAGGAKLAAFALQYGVFRACASGSDSRRRRQRFRIILEPEFRRRCERLAPSRRPPLCCGLWTSQRTRQPCRRGFTAGRLLMLVGQPKG